MPADGLIDRHVQFVGALRGAGLPVSLVESLDATQAMAVIDLWWPPAIGDGEAARGEGQGEGADGELQEIDPADLDAMKQMLRDQLRDVLLKGDDEALRRLARASVNGLGRTDSQPGRQSWFTYRVLRALSPETLMADLLKAVMEGQE